MSPWRNGHDSPIESDIARPIHQYSGRCQQSLAICGNKDTEKTAVPPCLYSFLSSPFNAFDSNPSLQPIELVNSRTILKK